MVRERCETSDLPGQRAQCILKSRALGWADSKTGAVLDEADLAVVEHGALGMRPWTEAEEGLVVASRAEAGRRRAEAARQKRELEAARQHAEEQR